MPDLTEDYNQYLLKTHFVILCYEDNYNSVFL